MYIRKGNKATLPVCLAVHFRRKRYAQIPKIIIPIAPEMAMINAFCPLPFLSVAASYSAYKNQSQSKLNNHDPCQGNLMTCRNNSFYEKIPNQLNFWL